MPEYTIEELEQMLNAARDERIFELIKTPEELEYEEMLNVYDLEVSYIKHENTILIARILKSQSLNKILLHSYYYIEEIENNEIVGRLCQGFTISRYQYNEQIPEQTLNITGTILAERG